MKRADLRPALYVALVLGSAWLWHECGARECRGLTSVHSGAIISTHPWDGVMPAKKFAPRDQTLTFKLTLNDRLRLEALAKKKKTTRSALTRHAVVILLDSDAP